MNIKKILTLSTGIEVILKGWIRFNRNSKNIGFLEIFDGSTLNGIQAVYKVENTDIFEKLSKITVWSAIELKGILVEGKQLEVNITEVINMWNSTEEHPLGKKEHGLEFLREISQLRVRTKTFQSIMKIRSILSFGVHQYFMENGFTYVQTPIITSNDAEGAGEAFFVKTSEGETFFSNQGILTVSGQLHAEAFVQAFGKVYTFGPTFRAENSNTTKHAVEFWMIEPEVAFTDYNEIMDIAEEQTKFVISKVMNEASDELAQLGKTQERDIVADLNNITENDFARISYREAIDILNQAQEEGFVFETIDIKFGTDLSTEHEKYLAEVKFNKPVFVFDYPESIKAFYMYKNDDETVRGFDLLVPGIGELIGGSQRIDNIAQLKLSAEKANIKIKDLEWYVNLRNEGYAPSSGYGLGFERLVMLVTGIENIRDVIPFPRTPGKLEF